MFVQLFFHRAHMSEFNRQKNLTGFGLGRGGSSQIQVGFQWDFYKVWVGFGSSCMKKTICHHYKFSFFFLFYLSFYPPNDDLDGQKSQRPDKSLHLFDLKPRMKKIVKILIICSLRSFQIGLQWMSKDLFLVFKNKLEGDYSDIEMYIKGVLAIQSYLLY